MTVDARQMMADAKFYESYSRWIPELNRKETWDEAVERVMKMHRDYYADKMSPDLEELISFAETHYKKKHVLGSQRALQFGGKQLIDHCARNFNCTVSHADRPAFFNEALYMLLCGAGVGFSVQLRHTLKLPTVKGTESKELALYTVKDSIEGWSDSLAVLLSSFFSERQTHPEFAGKRIIFDFSEVRPKGAPISGGFKAPGPDPLRKSLEKVESILKSVVKERGETKLKPIEVYDIVMHMADAVIAGGVRRSATICLFDFDDVEMMNAKTGDWFDSNPQRGRSNNSAMILRDEITWEQFSKIMKSVEQSGEPGFIFTDNLDFCYNPCVEIGMLPLTDDGRSGFQVCNLTEVNGAYCDSLESMSNAVKAGAILGTLQAGYTNFKYLSPETKEITDKEALLGVSITGWMNNPDVLFNEDNMRVCAREVKHWNALVANLIGINSAARTTCVKPSGNASVLLGTASGIHGEHSPRYLRHVQLNKSTDVSKALMEQNPSMCEESVWSANGTDIVVAFPVETPSGSIYKSSLYGVKQLEYVKKAQQVWVEEGTNFELTTIPSLRHNVSNTISVDNWDEVSKYVFENRKWFAGISFLSASGDRDYAQAPFTEVLTESQIVERYGAASLFASGLLVQGVEAFGHLWKACDTVLGYGEVLGDVTHENMNKHDFVRRAKKFSINYFGGDDKLMTYCLKDVYNLHKWESIKRSIKPIDWASANQSKSDVSADTLGAQGCSGGACELTF